MWCVQQQIQIPKSSRAVIASGNVCPASTCPLWHSSFLYLVVLGFSGAHAYWVPSVLSFIHGAREPLMDFHEISYFKILRKITGPLAFSIKLDMNKYNNPSFAKDCCTYSLLHAQQDALTRNKLDMICYESVSFLSIRVSLERNVFRIKVAEKLTHILFPIHFSSSNSLRGYCTKYIFQLIYSTINHGLQIIHIIKERKAIQSRCWLHTVLNLTCFIIFTYFPFTILLSLQVLNYVKYIYYIFVWIEKYNTFWNTESGRIPQPPSTGLHKLISRKTACFIFTAVTASHRLGLYCVITDNNEEFTLISYSFSKPI
jgi:hypothetical protein